MSQGAMFSDDAALRPRIKVQGIILKDDALLHPASAVLVVVMSTAARVQTRGIAFGLGHVLLGHIQILSVQVPENAVLSVPASISSSLPIQAVTSRCEANNHGYHKKEFHFSCFPLAFKF